jgi:hypothetical protein
LDLHWPPLTYFINPKHPCYSLNIKTKLTCCCTPWILMSISTPNPLEISCRNPNLRKCEGETHTPEMETWESFGTPKTSELDYRGQNTSPWSVLHIIGKLLNYRCRKWPCMSHLDICSTSYVQKKGRESNWQFDSRPLKVGNRPNLGMCKESATHRWKALKESYKFASDLIPIRRLSKELWPHKVPGVQIGTVSGLHFGSLGTKSHSSVGAAE